MGGTLLHKWSQPMRPTFALLWLRRPPSPRVLRIPTSRWRPRRPPTRRSTPIAPMTGTAHYVTRSFEDHGCYRAYETRVAAGHGTSRAAGSISSPRTTEWGNLRGVPLARTAYRIGWPTKSRLTPAADAADEQSGQQEPWPVHVIERHRGEGVGQRSRNFGLAALHGLPQQ